MPRTGWDDVLRVNNPVPRRPKLPEMVWTQERNEALVKVNAAIAGRAVGVLFHYGELEEITDGRMGIGTGHVQQVAKSRRKGCELARSEGRAVDQYAIKSATSRFGLAD